MKTNKILKIMATAISIILLVLISFIGIFVFRYGRWENVLKDFKLGMYFGGERQVIFTPSTETKTVYESDGKQLENIDNLSDEEKAQYTEKQVKINEDDILTVDNYKKALKIFKERLEKSGLSDYQINVDETTGRIVLNSLEDSVLDTVIYTSFETGKFELRDTDTQEVLLDSSYLDDARVAYGSEQNGTRVYLTLVLNSEGAKKLEEISSTYIQSTDEEGNTITKNVTLYINDTSVTTTYFGQTVTNGLIQLSMGNATTDTSELQMYIRQTSAIAVSLSTEPVDITYTMDSNKYLSSGISQGVIVVLLLAAIAIVTSMIVYIIAEYKDRGIVAGGAFIGYIASVLLAVRLSNTLITLQSLFGIAFSIIVNYVFLNILLARMCKYKEKDSTPKSEMSRTIIKFLYSLVPCLILSIVFSVITNVSISSFGMGLFWGVAMFVIYNIFITKPLMLNFEYLFEED